MKISFTFNLVLLLFWGIHSGFSQNISDRNNSISLPKNVQAIATKYNQTAWGENVFIFNPTMNMAEIQVLIDTIYNGLVFPNNEFSQKRYALLFQPGTYALNIKVGYYTHILGLGTSPNDVVIQGSVTSFATKGHVLCNFWRTVENLTIMPTSADTTNIWAVSQAAPLRRVHVKGHLKLYDGASSGGFMANCKIDGTVFSGSQQQWLTRNSYFRNWNGGVWNMMYMGVANAPKENWAEKPITTVNETPEIREKPYWAYSEKKFFLKIPPTKKKRYWC